MCTLDIPFGSRNAQEFHKSSQTVEVKPTSITSLHDLLALFESNPPTHLAMLRTTAGLLVKFFGSSPEEIMISALIQGREKFRRFLVHLRYEKNSVRSYMNYLSVIIKLANEAGWVSTEPPVPQCWQAILAELPTGTCRKFAHYAIEQKKTPAQLTDKDREYPSGETTLTVTDCWRPRRWE
jgi:hypothetical protein